MAVTTADEAYQTGYRCGQARLSAFEDVDEFRAHLERIAAMNHRLTIARISSECEGFEDARAGRRNRTEHVAIEDELEERELAWWQR